MRFLWQQWQHGSNGRNDKSSRPAIKRRALFNQRRAILVSAAQIDAASLSVHVLTSQARIVFPIKTKNVYILPVASFRFECAVYLACWPETAIVIVANARTQGAEIKFL